MEPFHTDEVRDILHQMAGLAPRMFSEDIAPSHYFRWQTPDGPRAVFAAIARRPADAPEAGMGFTRERKPSDRLFLRLVTFTDQGEWLSRVDVPLGQQPQIEKVRLVQEHPNEHGYLEITTTSSLLAARIRQYVTPIGSKWGLLRIAHVDVARREVNPQPNQYAPAEFSMAPPRAFEDIDEFVEHLGSDDVRKVLSALQWFVGKHENRQYKARGRDATFVNEARSHAQVSAALEKLNSHSNPWVQEALGLLRD